MPVKKNQLGKVEKSFLLPLTEIKKIIKNFHGEMEKGLANKKSSLRMIPAYVAKPTGEERGKYIALDLGGTNFRVLELELKGKGRMSPPEEKKFILEKKYTIGEGRDLFDFIAKCVKDFISTRKIAQGEKREIGFTFSFPVKQTGIASGILVNWTKDFSARGVEGRDVIKMLGDALKRSGIGHIKVSALVNDTVGTLVARAYQDSNCDVGLIIGTGTNACYEESITKIKKWQGAKKTGEKMIVNIEWGNFNRLPLNRFDKLLDDNSLNPGRQTLEKMVSGMYLGEIVRLVLRDCGLCGFSIAHSFKSEYISRIEADNSSDLRDVKAFFRGCGLGSLGLDERKMIKTICRLVTLRAARISAAALAAVVTKIDPALSKKHTVAIDGSVYEKHPGFSSHMHQALKEIFKSKVNRLKLVLAKDGSGKGAAIIASLA
ncbi:MAG: hypothetical protein MUC39_00010 [Candidatus Omnitrophica bacterium]|jgi:hexokinase|nr:hypothetical protein [Candidatus Omnitrophota bacterium]